MEAFARISLHRVRCKKTAERAGYVLGSQRRWTPRHGTLPAFAITSDFFSCRLVS